MRESLRAHKIENINRIVFISVLSLLVISIPLSEFGMSISQFLLFGFWFWYSDDYRQLDKFSFKRFFDFIGKNSQNKIRHFFSKPYLAAFTLIYFVHLAGLLYTSDINYALKDIRIKLPLFSLPFLLVFTPKLSKKQFYNVLILYIGAVFAGSLISLYTYFTNTIADPRELSLFISHIRFSLNVCLAIFILLYFIFIEKDFSVFQKVSFILSTLWLLVFIFILGAGTGLFVLLITGFITGILLIFKIRKKFMKVFILSSFLLVLLFFAYYLHHVNQGFQKPEGFVFEHLEKQTANGNLYTHDTNFYVVENGSYPGVYVCETELETAWEKRSSMPYSGPDHKKQPLKYTLIRYLNSKHLRKDANAVEQLSEQDIQNIEAGMTNREMSGIFSMHGRIKQIFLNYYTYQHTKNSNVKSLYQRLAYWKASLHLIDRSPVFGVGTGDIKTAFANYYEQSQSELSEKYRLRSHNQFLSITVALGILGLLVFLFSMFYPAIKLKAGHKSFFLIFFIISLLSMLMEDTLETQPGVTFFAFFYCFFLFTVEKDKIDNTLHPNDET